MRMIAPFFVFAVLSFAPASEIDAQQFSLGYHLVMGRTYRLHHVFDQTHHQRDAEDDDFVNTTDVDITVDSIDRAGNMSITFRTVKQDFQRADGTASRETESVASNGASISINVDPRDTATMRWAMTPVRSDTRMTVVTIRPKDPPRYRATLSPGGDFIHGEILEHTAEDSLFFEKMKQPGFQGSRISDARLVEMKTRSLFAPFPRRTITPGDGWADSELVSDGQATVTRVWNVDTGAHPAASQCWRVTCRRNSSREISSIGTYSQNGTDIYWFRRSDGLFLGRETLSSSTMSSTNPETEHTRTNSKSNFRITVDLIPR